MKIQKKKETFWTSGKLMEKLAEIPEGEKSTIIRMALRQYFGISNCKRPEPEEPLTLEEAKRVARLMMPK